MNALWNCIHDDDDDNIIEMNNMYCKIKFNTEQIIQFRKARGTHIKVRFCFWFGFCACLLWFWLPIVCVGFGFRLCVLVLASDCVCWFWLPIVCVVLASDYVIIHKHVFLLQVAEEAMRTKHELQKKERTSMLANISFEQHSFSLKPPATNQMQSPSSVCEKEQSFVTGITSKPPLPVYIFSNIDINLNFTVDQ
jgi:hypothetical protein